MTQSLLESATSTAALHRAWTRVRANAGASGSESSDVLEVESDLGRVIAELQASTRQGRYRPRPPLRTELCRPGKAPRQLAIPAVQDRILQTAVKNVLVTGAEMKFSDSSFGYRPGRSVQMATDHCRAHLEKGHVWVVDADIKRFFDSIPHSSLMRLLPGWVPDERLAEIMALWLDQNPGGRGIGQGSPISPLLSNVYLHELDIAFAASGVPMARYADDFGAFAGSDSRAAQVLQLAHEKLTDLGLELHPEKTRVLSPLDELNFLGQRLAIPSAQAKTPVHIQMPSIETPQAGSSAPDQMSVDVCPRGKKGAPAVGPTFRSLYLLEPNTWVRRDGSRLEVWAQKDKRLSIPVEKINSVVAFGNTNFTAGALHLLMASEVPVTHLTGQGKYMGSTEAIRSSGLQLQQAQFAAASSLETALEISREMVVAKVSNQLVVINRYLRNHHASDVEQHLDAMRQMRTQCRHVRTLEALRGCEGFAARSYFSAIKALLPAKWAFSGRIRPARDPVNALLSFGYSLLLTNVRSFLYARGFQPMLGFLHSPRAGHPALASDLMEEFRAPVVDALVLNTCFSEAITPADFLDGGDEGMRMNDAAVRRFLHAFEAKMQGSASAQRGGESVNHREAIDFQTAHLADYLRGKHAAYEGYRVR